MISIVAFVSTGTEQLRVSPSSTSWDRLVFYENYGDVRDAITREKEIKGWRREKKNTLVRTLNPLWKDLGQELFNRGR